jgi:hypothetical protein
MEPRWVLSGPSIRTIWRRSSALAGLRVVLARWTRVKRTVRRPSRSRASEVEPERIACCAPAGVVRPDGDRVTGTGTARVGILLDSMARHSRAIGIASIAPLLVLFALTSLSRWYYLPIALWVALFLLLAARLERMHPGALSPKKSSWRSRAFWTDVLLTVGVTVASVVAAAAIILAGRALLHR